MDTDSGRGMLPDILDDFTEQVDDLMSLNRGEGGAKAGQVGLIHKEDRCLAGLFQFPHLPQGLDSDPLDHSFQQVGVI